jgi:LacI family transcriptional regulator
MARVRLKDVAQAAGVSDATVSLALSGSPRISAKTRKLIEETALRLGYQPNAAARALRTEATNTLGLIIGDVANPFFAELAGEVERLAVREGYSVMLCDSDEDSDRQDAYLSKMLAGSQVDAVMLVPTAAMTPAIRAAGQDARRLVLVDRPIEVPGRGATADYLRSLPVVRSDPKDALRDAATLLAALGHRRVGVVAPPVNTLIGRERRDAIHAALTGQGIAPTDILVEAGDFRQGSGERAMEKLLDNPDRPTAVIAGDGPMAIGVLKELRRAGLRVPTDISVIGFDDAPWLDLFDPPLTTIAQPVHQLAAATVEAILALVRGTKLPSPQALQPACSLVVRSSCGTAPDQ